MEKVYMVEWVSYGSTPVPARNDVEAREIFNENASEFLGTLFDDYEIEEILEVIYE